MMCGLGHAGFAGVAREAESKSRSLTNSRMKQYRGHRTPVFFILVCQSWYYQSTSKISLPSLPVSACG
jgi:hypothetical protein